MGPFRPQRWVDERKDPTILIGDDMINVTRTRPGRELEVHHYRVKSLPLNDTLDPCATVYTIIRTMSHCTILVTNISFYFGPVVLGGLLLDSSMALARWMAQLKRISKIFKIIKKCAVGFLGSVLLSTDPIYACHDLNLFFDLLRKLK